VSGFSFLPRLTVSGFLLLLSIQVSPLPAEESGGPSEKTYRIQTMEGKAMEVDGVDNEEAWRNIRQDKGFSWPWKKGQAPPTSFRAFCSAEFVFFFFDVTDRDVVTIRGPEEKTVAGGDRVELFFSVDREMKKYYCLEIDAFGKVLDYQASFYRNFDESWDLPGLRASGRRTPSGYTVEAAIPVEWFRESGICNMQPGSRIIAGIYRGEFSRSQTDAIEQSWISWQDPGTEKPDFHIPSSLGIFVVDDRVSSIHNH